MGKRPNFLLDRYRSQARIHASARSVSDSPGESILPTYLPTTNSRNSETGGQDVSDHGRALHVANHPEHEPVIFNTADGAALRNDSSSISSSFAEKSNGNDNAQLRASQAPAPAAPPHKSEDAPAGDPALGTIDAVKPPKPPIFKRMTAGSKRFAIHLKDALFHSWVNVLLVAVPVGIAVKAIGLQPAVIFAINAVAIVPLAGLLAYATESVASRLGDTLGALLNVSFGNAVELIIFIIALVKDEISIVQASILGSILANLLLILGMAFLLGGLRYREQVYNNTVTQMSACLLSLSVTSLLLPTAFHAAFNDNSSALANTNVLKVSRGTSVVLLIVYVLYLLFQLKSHAYMYESTPQEIIDEESHPGVLADIMNSSSSSDSDSDSDSSDSSASGSIITTGKRVKRMFKQRRRRKSSGTVSSVVTSPSVLSTPSTTERNDYPWLSQVRHLPGSRRLSATTDGNEAEMELDDASPRIRDFGEQPHEHDESAKAPEPKKHRKFRSQRKHRKHKHRRHGKDEETAPVVQDASSANQGPKVEFADEVQVAPDQPAATQEASTSKLPFNMRQISSRNVLRPALQHMLSNTVFVQPAPNTPPAPRPGQIRSHSVGGGTPLRRTSSLPDNLAGRANAQATPHVSHTDPLPPFQHQRAAHRQADPERIDSTPDSDEEHPEGMSRTAAIVLLLCTTVLVAICAEFMVDAIPGMIASSSVSQAFIGLIILPIVGNAAEHVTAVTVAAKNKMDLAIGVAVGSSIQIALFVTPLVVLLGWILNKDMTLYFNIFDTVCLFVTAFVVNFLILDGRSNYLEGSLLIAAYVIIALGAFFYPPEGSQSNLGAGGS